MSNTSAAFVRTILYSSFAPLCNVSVVPGTHAGQLVSLSKRNCAWSFFPCSDLCQHMETFIPGVAKSAASISPGTCLHCSAGLSRDVLARDEPTRTRCGPLPSWAPKIETLKKINNMDFNFQNQDQDITNYNSYIVKIKIYENTTEIFSYVGRKNYDMSGKIIVFPGKITVCAENFFIPGKITICAEKFLYVQKNLAISPPPPAHQNVLENFLILTHASLRLGPLRRCSFVVVFKTPARPWVCRLDFPILLGTKRPVNLNTSLGHWHCRHHLSDFSFRH